MCKYKIKRQDLLDVSASSPIKIKIFAIHVFTRKRQNLKSKTKWLTVVLLFQTQSDVEQLKENSKNKNTLKATQTWLKIFIEMGDRTESQPQNCDKNVGTILCRNAIVAGI